MWSQRVGHDWMTFTHDGVVSYLFHHPKTVVPTCKKDVAWEIRTLPILTLPVCFMTRKIPHTQPMYLGRRSHPLRTKEGQCCSANLKTGSAMCKGNWHRVSISWGSTGESTERYSGVCISKIPKASGQRLVPSPCKATIQEAIEFFPLDQVFETTLYQ